MHLDHGGVPKQAGGCTAKHIHQVIRRVRVLIWVHLMVQENSSLSNVFAQWQSPTATVTVNVTCRCKLMGAELPPYAQVEQSRGRIINFSLFASAWCFGWNAPRISAQTRLASSVVGGVWCRIKMITFPENARMLFADPSCPYTETDVLDSDTLSARCKASLDGFPGVTGVRPAVDPAFHSRVRLRVIPHFR